MTQFATRCSDACGECPRSGRGLSWFAPVRTRVSGVIERRKRQLLRLVSRGAAASALVVDTTHQLLRCSQRRACVGAHRTCSVGLAVAVSSDWKRYGLLLKGLDSVVWLFGGRMHSSRCHLVGGIVLADAN